MKRVLALCLALLAAPSLADPVRAATSAEALARKPDLFHPETGYRIDRQRAPTPQDVPAGRRVSAAEVAAMPDALRIDVYGAAQSRYDELDGTWLVPEPRASLPGAVWLPETGRGTLDDTMQRYFAAALARLTEGDKDHAVIFFCVADCWMSWNATRRAAALGYTRALWFREGTDGWLDAGYALAPVDPLPVGVDD